MVGRKVLYIQGHLKVFFWKITCDTTKKKHGATAYYPCLYVETSRYTQQRVDDRLVCMKKKNSFPCFPRQRRHSTIHEEKKNTNKVLNQTFLLAEEKKGEKNLLRASRLLTQKGEWECSYFSLFPKTHAIVIRGFFGDTAKVTKDRVKPESFWEIIFHAQLLPSPIFMYLKHVLLTDSR